MSAGVAEEGRVRERTNVLSEEKLSWRLWALIPMLAFAAYATVLRIGFLADDIGLLQDAQAHTNPFQALLPIQAWYFYRPVGTFLTWEMGWELWGLNPLPYHLLGLAIHAGAALVLGLWAVEASGRRWSGWLAGALFAVYPLHTEAVGWLSAQWDAWATLFGLLGLLFFTRWWRSRRRLEYAIGLLFYALGVFSKESMLPFLPLLAVAVWMVTPQMRAQEWRRVGVALVPFAGTLLLNLAIRYMAWGSIGGYRGISTDYRTFFWDQYIVFMRLLIAPVNREVVGNGVAQVVEAAATILLLVGLALYGRKASRMLVMSTLWIVVTLTPVLNVGVNNLDMSGNRFLYLPAAGFCVGVAALIYEGVRSARRRQVALSLVGALLLFCVGLSWVQLLPWHTATVQATELEAELDRLVPPVFRPARSLWYVQNAPDMYKGAYTLRSWTGGLRHFVGVYSPQVKRVENVTDPAQAPLAAQDRETFAFRFLYDEKENRNHVDYAAGISPAEPPPTGALPGLKVWDFEKCPQDTISAWTVRGVVSSCLSAEGLQLQPQEADPQMHSPRLEVQPSTKDARFVRVRVSVSHPLATQAKPYVSQWYWKGQGEDWSEKRSLILPIKQDGKSHVYWTFISAKEAQKGVEGLRFDPVNGKVDATVQWIAVDEVK